MWIQNNINTCIIYNITYIKLIHKKKPKIKNKTLQTFRTNLHLKPLDDNIMQISI